MDFYCWQSPHCFLSALRLDSFQNLGEADSSLRFQFDRIKTMMDAFNGSPGPLGMNRLRLRSLPDSVATAERAMRMAVVGESGGTRPDRHAV
ncbi:hypothetical protein Q31b_24970 [Novipirellula aureliae]|uniref:Uncharacterized protein n=2 Tax=Novipirellula aureliae TaxID=2527966 RepID=A0A5C6E7K7_9BACT|nr:hypothetical protein Q31b_24970 [Novipirellula aureliae]